MFADLLKFVDGKKLGYALLEARKIVDKHPYLLYSDQLVLIEEDYKRMLDFMLNGYEDPSREEMYKSLLLRLSRLVQCLIIAEKIHKNSFFAECYRIASSQSFSMEKTRTVLHDYVSDVAMLSLEPDSLRDIRSRKVYHAHHLFISNLFSEIIVQPYWTESQATDFEQLILSPVTDRLDAQILVSAVMMSALNNFDKYKVLMMLHVYQNSHDEWVRQRALVGFVFSLYKNTINDDTFKDEIRRAFKDEATLRDVVDMQKQVIFCMMAEKDNEIIQKDIMPALIKNNNLEITKNGIVEKEEDPMDDILDLNDQDQAMEEAEDSMRRMIDMQKAGSDIYFGGFSHMKRYTFFSTLANWFMPFYMDHPELKSVKEKFKDSTLLDVVLSNGAFCDSDKYSLALTMSSMLSQIPENMREMLGNKEMAGHVIPEEEKNTPDYIRRAYLQNLYRFFKLYPLRDQLYNPFGSANHLFSTYIKSAYAPQITHYLRQLALFLYKHKIKEPLIELVKAMDFEGDVKGLMLKGRVLCEYCDDIISGGSCYIKAAELAPDNITALYYAAGAYMERGEIEQAHAIMEDVLEREPDKPGYILDYCKVLNALGQYEEALVLLHKLRYEFPDSVDVRRGLGLNYMGLVRLEDAAAEYDFLISSGNLSEYDYINAGYCKWLKGDIKASIDLFVEYVRHYAASTYPEEDVLAEIFEYDMPKLKAIGLTEIDFKLICDMVLIRMESGE